MELPEEKLVIKLAVDLQSKVHGGLGNAMDLRNHLRFASKRIITYNFFIRYLDTEQIEYEGDC